MNYTLLKDAYKNDCTPYVDALRTSSQFTIISNNDTPIVVNTYSPICIYCKNPTTIPFTNDGGSIRYCNLCKNQFKADIESK